MTFGALVIAAEGDDPLTCGRCRREARRLIRPYWRDSGPMLCPACCEAACVHYETLPEGWPVNPLTGKRPSKLAELQSFWNRCQRFPRDDEVSDDGVITFPPEPDPEPEETPEW